MPDTPRVSVLVLNYNGREHLQTCLPSLNAQVFPKDRVRIEVIDNGSTDGSVDFVREAHPNTIVHRFNRNHGFAYPYDVVARASDSDFLVLLNNDTRVEPTWLAELVSAAERHQAHCVASRILDWNGERIDFVGGTLAFNGHSWQRHIGAPAALSDMEERPLLFACGGSMLISREAYIDADGFDRDFFAYFEDVDLGWRLSLLGYRIVLAPRAVTYHRLHGTAGRIALAQRLRLYERNALAMLYKNYDEESLRRVLPAAIALSLVRGLSQSGMNPEAFRFGVSLPPTLDLAARTVVQLLALEDFGGQLPALTRKRAAIQSRRRRSDAELAPLFGEPFRLHETGRYEKIAWTLIREFGIEDIFAAVGMPPVGRPVTVPDIPSASASALSASVTETPSVSVVILTLLGPTHLADCLSSLRAQSHPASRCEVIIVDNASKIDPTRVAMEHYPGARVIRNQQNLGFAAANNIGARAASSDYLVFLNDDTRVHPDFLRELIGTVRRRNAAAVGSRIVSWDGRRIDFVGGSVNCEGKGFQLDFGSPVAGRHDEERPLFFPCGAAMLVDRQVFLDSGCWDEDTFAYYEDVELGWRYWLLGHEVWLSPQSIVYHKHHGTSARSPEAPRMRLYERNSLRMLYTHLERETLARVLPGALMLAVDRALLGTALSRAHADADGPEQRRRLKPKISLLLRTKIALRAHGVRRTRSVLGNLRTLGAAGLVGVARDIARLPDPRGKSTARSAYQIERGAGHLLLDGCTEPFPATGAAALGGVYDFLNGLPELSERRRWLQQSRQRSDAEILGRFGINWLSPGPAHYQSEHEQLHSTLLETLGIAALARTWNSAPI